MPNSRKSYPPSLKAKVAVEAIRGQRTTAQIAQVYSIHPALVSAWKKQALEALPGIFQQLRDGRTHAGDAEKDELCRQTGELKVELDWAKKGLACSVEEQRRSEAQELSKHWGPPQPATQRLRGCGIYTAAMRTPKGISDCGFQARASSVIAVTPASSLRCSGATCRAGRRDPRQAGAGARMRASQRYNTPTRGLKSAILLGADEHFRYLH